MHLFSSGMRRLGHRHSSCNWKLAFSCAFSKFGDNTALSLCPCNELIICFVAVWSPTRQREEQLHSSAWRLLREFLHLMTRWRGWSFLMLWSEHIQFQSCTILHHFIPHMWPSCIDYILSTDTGPGRLPYLTCNICMRNVKLWLTSCLNCLGCWGCNLATNFVCWDVCLRKSDGTITTLSRWVTLWELISKLKSVLLYTC